MLQADSLPSEPPGKPMNTGVGSLSLLQGILPSQESNRSGDGYEGLFFLFVLFLIFYWNVKILNFILWTAESQLSFLCREMTHPDSRLRKTIPET